MGRLTNKVAIITGAAVGMGAEHARLFVEEGAKVVITDLNETDGAVLAKELGENALFVKHDVSDADSWADVVAAAVEKFGPVTVLVNNAGLSGPEAFTADLDLETFNKVVAVDQTGVFLGMRAVLPGMVEAGGGSIVNISSAAAMAHLAGSPSVAYTGAKAAVRGMTKATAIEYGPHNVRVNSVHPGAILTPMAKNLMDPETIEAFAQTLPIRRFADPREVSYTVLFLASDEASYMTGSELVVDGGRLAE
ncbi:glucose 1-dehydrogenase [Arthrobacter sp. I2-34]|uniref:Glucose 1-dehydrogenase n=1 Tax=Arthrobacter hankyongi TaxID=2904801 RepID=A0ABS9LDG2_9MICC|nr:glucose 1-dehydrogenase [Arthrobacter hankyongi]MCG2624728.1 glucose 1-dehydrogenase [Arthrobacter hankyongi]